MFKSLMTFFLKVRFEYLKVLKYCHRCIGTGCILSQRIETRCIGTRCSWVSGYIPSNSQRRILSYIKICRDIWGHWYSDYTVSHSTNFIVRS